MAFDEEKGSISAASDEVRAFKEALRIMQERLVKILQKNKQIARQSVADTHRKQKYADDATGRLKPIANYGRAWKLRKFSLGLSLNRGRASGGIQKALDKKSAAKNTKKGFELNFEASAATTFTRYPRKRGAAKRVNVGRYLMHFAEKKAPSLGALPRKERLRLEKLLQAEFEKVLTSAKAGAKARGGKIFLDLTFKTFGLEAA